MALSAARGLASCSSISRLAFTNSRHGFYQTQRNRLLAVANVPYTSLSGTEQFKIRLIKTEKEFKSIIINAMVKEGWGPGLQDAECFMACDPTAGFVGELSGKPICCCTMAKYGDRYAFGGCYIVSDEFRGKGYGEKLYYACMASVKHFPSIALISGLKREEINKRNGFRSVFYGAFFVFNIPTAIGCFSRTLKRSHVKIKRIEEVNMQELFKYDTTVFGFERHAFLSKWLRMANSHARVAIDSEGSIVGYTVARPTFIKESYKIGPLFADSEAIAEKLLKAVFEELLREEVPPPVVCIDAPTEKATKLCERLQGKRSFELVYMVANDLPDACFDKWFGYTTVQFG
ncbi:holothin acyltransferase-like [Montipora capricornis]|uniref:holothin acyltransferase-like n=1 Tax=Montipora capricornis TaxID=246305 RepID=UPI0035F1DB59